MSRALAHAAAAGRPLARALAASLLLLSGSVLVRLGPGSGERVAAAADQAMAADSLDCARLDSTLRALVASAEPARFAAERSLHYVDGRVRVIIELVASSSAVPLTSSIVPEGRYGRLAQALVPVAELCALSREPTVRRVRAPHAADAPR